MSYRPIENYAMIGDMHSAALVGTNGSIDWLCLPRFDSPSVFAAILDDTRGGRFQIAPSDPDVTSKQFYGPDTNVLVTRFLAPDGAAELTDFMPVGAAVAQHEHRQLLRRVSAVRRTTRFRLKCRPAFNYARDAHQVTLGATGALFTAPQLRLGLATRLPLRKPEGGVVAEFTLNEGESAVLALREVDGKTCGECLSPDDGETLFRDTVDYWRRWIGQCTYKGRWRETVHRSALALKLLTYEPTGAIVAAPTCSLPEGVGGEEGKFNICTFWLVEALTRAGKFRPERPDEARLIFERMLGFANHVGLYAEETGPRGEALGNFPQAFTHLALISAATNLDRALGARA